MREWPAGEPDSREVAPPAPFTWPMDEHDLQDLRWYLEQYLRTPFGVYTDRGREVEAQLRRWGAKIFEAAFRVGPARDAYIRARTRGGPLEIVITSATAGPLALPWELMVDPSRPAPVALDQVAILRSLPVPVEANRVSGARLRVLMVISRPAGPNDVGYRLIARPLLRCLEAVPGAVDLVVLRPPTLQRLEQVLTAARDAGDAFQIVHFDGHGRFGGAPDAVLAGGTGYGKGPGPEGVLVFEGAGGGEHRAPAGEVARVLAQARVPVVVLNACESAVMGSRLEAAVATRLLQEGTTAVVAMAYTVYTAAAAEFMTAFYERLFSGGSVAEAVTAGREQLATANLRTSPKGQVPLADWMVPVLYARGEARFPNLRTRSPARGAGESPDGNDQISAAGEFVGRDTLFHALETATRRQRVVVLHGPAGVGKTELAKAFGRWARDTDAVDGSDCVIWHSFEPGVATFGLEGVINSIGIQSGITDFPKLHAARRSVAVEDAMRTRRLLLILDNIESAHSMPDPAQATPVLADQERHELREFLARVTSAGSSAVVVTSRTTEDWLGNVCRVAVPGLEPEEAHEYTDRILGRYPLARRRRQTRDFGELLQWLDGHPLTMRLVLPHLSTTEPRVLLSGLQGSVSLPGSDSGARTDSLSASIGYSFNCLSSADQRALVVLALVHDVASCLQLGVFSDEPDVPERFGGRTAQDWDELLARAARVGLLVKLEVAGLPNRYGASLYGVHPALPAYLAARWRADDPDTRLAATHALLMAYGGFGAWVHQQLRSGSAALAVTLVGHQRRTMGALLNHALDNGEWDAAEVLIAALENYCELQGLSEEARAWSDRALGVLAAGDGTSLDPDSPAGGLWQFAVASRAKWQTRAGQDDLTDQAEDTYLQLLDRLVKQPESSRRDSKLMVCCHQLGVIAHNAGALDDAEEWYRMALKIGVARDDKRGMSSTFHQLGNLVYAQGRVDEAEDLAHGVLQMEKDLGSQQGMAVAYHQLGLLARARDDLDEAEDWYLEALGIQLRLDDQPGVARTYHHLGVVTAKRGHLEAAEGHYQRALVIREALADPQGMAHTYGALGLLAEKRDRLREALAWTVRAVTLFDEFPHPDSEPAPTHLKRLVGLLGTGPLEETWLSVTGASLPPTVRRHMQNPAQPSSEEESS